MISISRLQNDIEIHDCTNERIYSKDELTCLAGGYQRFFESQKLKRGDRISLCLQEDIHHLAVVFASIDYGLVPVISGDHYIDDEYCARSNIRIVLTRGIQPVTVKTINVPHIELDGNIEPSKLYRVNHNDIILESFTSGTTGHSKTVTHTHESITCASNDSIKHYWKDAKTSWFYHNIVHLGVSTVYFFPALFSSKKVVLPHLWDTYDVETFNKHKPDTMLLFPSNYEQYENLSKLDLSHVRYVLTGGSTIPKTFCEKLIEQGVSDVVVIYGLTECLPPIMHKFVNKQNIADYNQQDMGVNCDDTAEYKIDRHGELVIVKSKHLAKQINDSNVDTLNTGDRVNTVGDNYYFEKRNKDFIRINGELVNPQQLVDESQATKIVLFGTSQTHVVVCVNDDSVNTDSLIQKLTGQGISYDKLIIPIELNVLGKPDIGKLRQKYVSN